MEAIQSLSNPRLGTARALRKASNLWLTFISMCIFASGLTLVGCTDDHQQNSDELREKTAERTAEVKRDAKSVAEGVKEGWNRDEKRVDLNTATREQLIETGLDREQCDRVIAHRPYSTPRQLVTKRVLSDDEYKQIEPRVKAGDPSNN